MQQETEHKSRYAEKRQSGRMMYGPGCCGHSVTPAQLMANRRRVAKERGEGVYIPPQHVPEMTWTDDAPGG